MFKPLGEYVVVKPIEKEKTTESGLVIPDTAKEKSNYGKVIAVGPGKLLESGERAAPQVSEGNKVFFNEYGGVEMKSATDTLIIIKEADIFAEKGEE